ncbi:hypothetical protein CR513_35292, partial [Mucuna pruriens]
MKEQESKKPTKLSYCANTISHTTDLQIQIRTRDLAGLRVLGSCPHSWEPKNNPTYSTTNHFPFEVVYGFNPLTPLDLILLSTNKQVHQASKKKIEYVRQLHENVKQQIEKKTRYVNQANKGHKKVSFEPDD